MDKAENDTVSNERRNLSDEDLTKAVLASFGGSTSGRFKEVVESLVEHLHSFIGEVELTEDEWFEGIDYLTRTGHITDDKRQEFVLLSGRIRRLDVGDRYKQPPATRSHGIHRFRAILRRRFFPGSRMATTFPKARQESHALCKDGCSR